MAGHTKPSSHAAARVQGWRGVLNAKIPAPCEPGRGALIGLKVFGSPEPTYRGRFEPIGFMEKHRFSSAGSGGGSSSSMCPKSSAR